MRRAHHVLAFAVAFWVMSLLLAACEGPVAPQGLTDEERTWLAAHSTVRVGVESAFPPFVYLDDKNEPRGLSVDVLRHASASLGLRLEFVTSGNLSTLLESARSGEVDVLTSVMETTERATFLDFTRPYVSTPAVILVGEQRPGTFTMKDLSGQIVAVGRKYAVESFVRSRYPDVRLQPVANDHEALRMLSFGEVAAAITDEAAARQFIESQGLPNLRIAGEVGFEYTLSMAVARNAPLLRSALDKALAQMGAEPGVTRIGDWAPGPSADARGWRFALLALLGACVLPIAWLVRRRRFSGALPIAALVVGLALTLTISLDERARAVELTKTRFELRVLDLMGRVEQRLAAYEEVLRGARGLFEGSEKVGRDEFAAYVDSLALEQRYPGVQGLGFAVVVRPEDREAHVAQVRREVAEPIYELHPAGERDLTTSIVYLEPFRDRNLRAFGYDMYSEPVRRAALERARDTDDAALSGRVTLVQETETDPQPGFLLLLPVYRNGAPHASIEERRANLVGWVYEPFRAHDFMGNIRGPQYADLDLALYDGDETTDAHLLYATSQPPGEPNGQRFATLRALEQAGRQWTLAVTSAPAFDRELAMSLPHPLMGVAISVLAAALLFQLLRQRARALSLAHAMTADLRDSRAIFANAFGKSPLLMTISDLTTGRYLEVNDAFCEVSGFSRDEALGKTSVELGWLGATERDRLRDEVQRQGKIGGLELALRSKSGVPVVCRYWGDVVETAQGQRLLSVAEDISARVEIEGALKTSEERYRLLFAEMQEGFSLNEIVTDAAGDAVDFRIVAANAAYERHTGLKAEETIGKSLLELLPQADRSQIRAYGKVALTGEPMVFEYFSKSFGRWFRVRAFCPRHGQFATVFEDISARKHTEESVARSNAQLAELNLALESRIREGVALLRVKDKILISQNRRAAMGEMLGNIAHQWRQPLNALGLVLANLQDAWRFGALDEPTMMKAKSDGNLLIQKMSSTIGDFANFFRTDKERAPFSALAQVRAAVGLLAAVLEHDGIAVEVEAAEDVTLFGFANEYSQALMNLLSNARQAILAAKVEAGRITVSIGVREGLGCVTVRDNGGGISPVALDRLFEPYFSTKEGGTGIGLYMSRQIIEDGMRGRLEARNVDGGAEFSMLAPLGDKA